MFFRIAVKTRSRWLQKAIYWGQIPMILITALGCMTAIVRTAGWAVAASGSAVAQESFGWVSSALFQVGAVVLAVYALDRWFRYRAGGLLICTLSICPEDVYLEQTHLRRGSLIVALRMGELYNFMKFWPLRLTAKELILFVYLETYKGVLNLIEQIKSGTAPIDESTPLMTTTPLLTAASPPGLVVSSERIKPRRGLIYRLAMGLALRRNPFSSRIPRPRVMSRRMYFTAQVLVDSESFFRKEVARLSPLTEKILEQKQKSRDIRAEPTA